MNSSQSTIAPGDHLFDWKVVSIDGRRATCRCRCGSIRIVVLADLLSGVITSCGCSTPTPQKLRVLREAEKEKQRHRVFDWRLERGR
jgi:hypothetical protein